MRKPIKKLLILFLLFVVILIGICFVLSLGYYNPGSTAGVYNFKCASFYGYYCNHPVFDPGSGNLTLTLAQYTGKNWTGWAIGYEPVGANVLTSGLPDAVFSSVSGLSNLSSAQIVQITLSVLRLSLMHNPVGGNLWVCYSNSRGVTGIRGGLGTCVPMGNQSASVKFIQIATVSSNGYG